MVTQPRIIRRTEAERREYERILTTKERAKALTAAERARRAAEAKAAIAQREFEKKIEAAREKGVEFERKLGMLEPTRGPVAPTGSIFQAPRPGTAILQATANRYQQRALSSIVQKAQQQGITKAKDVQISGLSQAAYRYTQKFAKTTRKGAPILQEKIAVVSPTTGKIIRYPIEDVVRGAEAAGMIPGGIEVMARRPEVIVPAVAVGVAQVAAMPAVIKEDPKQFISSIITLGLLFKAVPAAKVTVKAAKPVTAKAYAQTVKLMADDLAAIGYKPYKVPVKELPKVDLSKASFDRVFQSAIKNAEKQAKRDLTATEKANIRASIKRSRQSEIEAVMRAEKKAKARAEDTLAKKISKQFEKERLATERKAAPKPTAAEAKKQAMYERAKVIDITKKSRNLAEKAERLQAKYEAGTISKSVYDRQKTSILKQAKEIDDLRKGAIEVNKKAGKQPKAKQFEQIKPAPKAVTSAFAKAKAKAKAIAKGAIAPAAFVAAMTRANAIAAAYEATKVKPMPKAKPAVAVKPVTKVAVGVKRARPKVTPAKPRVAKKKPTPRIVKKEPPLKVPVIPKFRPIKKKKPVKVVRKVAKEYTHFQIVNQIGGIHQLFG